MEIFNRIQRCIVGLIGHIEELEAENLFLKGLPGPSLDGDAS